MGEERVGVEKWGHRVVSVRVCVCTHLFMKEYFLCVVVPGVYILVESMVVMKGRRENN